MRKFHRWVSAAAMALLAWVAITGVLLALLGITVKYLPPLNNNNAATAFEIDANASPQNSADAQRRLTSALHTALSSVPASRYTDIDVQLQMVDGVPRTAVNLNGELTRQLLIDADQGTALAAPVTRRQTEIAAEAAGLKEWQIKFLKMRTTLHVVLERLHRGNIIGITGQAMDILTGVAFIILCITGIFMYFEMLGRRRKLGRNDLFWK
ncbi:MAG: PepSY-associated TM helix domain-containing protein [Steroidobacteraceae bacterium]